MFKVKIGKSFVKAVAAIKISLKFLKFIPSLLKNIDTSPASSASFTVKSTFVKLSISVFACCFFSFVLAPASNSKIDITEI